MSGLVVVGAGLLIAVSVDRTIERRIRVVRGETSPGRAGLGRGRFVLALGLGLLLVWSVGLPAALVVGAVGGAVVRLWSHRRGRDRAARSRMDVVRLGRAWAAELRAGRPAAAALAAASRAVREERFRAELCDVVAAASRGDVENVGPLLAAVALGDEDTRFGLRQYATCWQVGMTAGGRLADLIERTAETLRAELEMSRALSTALAGPQMTMRLLAALPAAGLLLGTVIGAHPTEFLLHSSLGGACLGIAVFLEGIGVVWSRRIAGRARPGIDRDRG